MSLFGDLVPRPPDAILGLMERFRSDERPHKISLAQGVYVDERGVTPVLRSVTQAEERILAQQTTKAYKPIGGDPAFLDPVRELVFGPGHPAVAAGRVELLHTPGGTGALRVAADLIAAVRPGASVWLSEPTWPNHPQVFAAAGLPLRTYPYLGPSGGVLDLEGLLSALRGAAHGDVVVLHGCCHNPTGVDPTAAQWESIAEAITEAGLLPLVDLAYQGLGEGLVEDGRGLAILAGGGEAVLVASSFSKSFALYDERVGALSIVGSDPAETAALLSHAKGAVRASYSNPPAHGGEIVATVLADEGLRTLWQAELRSMRERINDNRARFVQALGDAGVPGDHAPLLRQGGMFSLLMLSDDQVARLRDEHAIYVVGRGRINVAGLTKDNLGPVCRAIGHVTGSGPV